MCVRLVQKARPLAARHCQACSPAFVIARSRSDEAIPASLAMTGFWTVVIARPVPQPSSLVGATATKVSELLSLRGAAATKMF